VYYLSIKLHSFVHYSPRDVHRIADKLNNALKNNVQKNAVQCLYLHFLIC